MFTYPDMWRGYHHVASQDLVSEVSRLLRIVDPGPTSTSLVARDAALGEIGLIGLRGLGKEIWRDEDAQRYVDHLRKEWGP